MATYGNQVSIWVNHSITSFIHMADQPRNPGITFTIITFTIPRGYTPWLNSQPSQQAYSAWVGWWLVGLGLLLRSAVVKITRVQLSKPAGTCQWYNRWFIAGFTIVITSYLYMIFHDGWWSLMMIRSIWLMVNNSVHVSLTMYWPRNINHFV